MSVRPAWGTVQAMGNWGQRRQTSEVLHDGTCPSCGDSLKAGDVIILQGASIVNDEKGKRIDLSDAEWVCPDCGGM